MFEPEIALSFHFSQVLFSFPLPLFIYFSFLLLPMYAINHTHPPTFINSSLFYLTTYLCHISHKSPDPKLSQRVFHLLLGIVMLPLSRSIFHQMCVLFLFQRMSPLFKAISNPYAFATLMGVAIFPNPTTSCSRMFTMQTLY